MIKRFIYTNKINIILLFISLIVCFYLANCNSFYLLKDDSELVLLGSVTVKDDKVLSLENVIWSSGNKLQNADFSDVQEKKIDVDVVNCAGYIGSGKAVTKTGRGWKLLLNPESVASDAADKIKKCVESSTEGYFISSAFAIFPVNENRRNVKSNKIEKPLIYSLPTEVQTWALNKDIESWTDTDEDGKADLISISSSCNGSEENICTKIFSWKVWRWIEIANISPS